MTVQTETCSKGHPMTPANTYLRRGTEPVCRACQTEYQRQHRARLKDQALRGDRVAPTKRVGVQDRLMSQIEVLSNGCWQWTGFVDNEGYGRTSYKGRRSTPTHQAFYDLHVGPIPEGNVLDHTCHTKDMACPGGPTCAHRRCVNPAHLEPVTSEENSSRGVFGRRTHCPKGHPYSEENTLVSNRRRYCRTCQRAHSVAQQAKAAAKKSVAA